MLSTMRKRLLPGVACAALCITVGCSSTKTSNTARTSQEQLLISNAVDQSLDKVDFAAFQGTAVFLDEKYLDCVDKPYVVGSIRHRIVHSGARLVTKPEEADVIVEARSGGVGTSTTEKFWGIPEISLPIPLPISTPEIKFVSKSSQSGTAKLGLVAYDAKTRQLLGDGGVSLARSDDNNWYVLGMGPYQDGTVRSEINEGIRVGGKTPTPLPNWIAFDTPAAGSPASPGNGLQWANGENTDNNRVTPASR